MGALLNRGRNQIHHRASSCAAASTTSEAAQERRCARLSVGSAWRRESTTAAKARVRMRVARPVEIQGGHQAAKAGRYPHRGLHRAGSQSLRGVENTPYRGRGHRKRLRGKVNQSAQSLEGLYRLRDATKLGGVHQPAEPAQHVHKGMGRRERLAGSMGREDYIVQVLEDAEARARGSQEPCAMRHHLGEELMAHLIPTGHEIAQRVGPRRDKIHPSRDRGRMKPRPL